MLPANTVMNQSILDNFLYANTEEKEQTLQYKVTTKIFGFFVSHSSRGIPVKGQEASKHKGVLFNIALSAR